MENTQAHRARDKTPVRVGDAGALSAAVAGAQGLVEGSPALPDVGQVGPVPRKGEGGLSRATRDAGRKTAGLGQVPRD